MLMKDTIRTRAQSVHSDVVTERQANVTSLHDLDHSTFRILCRILSRTSSGTTASTISSLVPDTMKIMPL